MKLNKTTFVNKMKMMIKLKKDFKDEFNKDIILPFTHKTYNYFYTQNNIKYIHKDSMRELHRYDCEDMFKLFRSNNTFLPILLDEKENFFLFEWTEGEVIKNIDKEDFIYLKQIGIKLGDFSPFHNSLYTNIIRTNEPTDNIKIIDLKHLDKHISDLPHIDVFWMFMYNSHDSVNDLYIETGAAENDLTKILEFLKRDYETDTIKITQY